MNEFRSKWLQFCSYVHTTGQLEYLRAELGSDGKTWFYFSDPDDLAPNLEFQFSQGAMVNATQLFGSLNFLRKEMSIARGERPQGNQHVTRRNY